MKMYFFFVMSVINYYYLKKINFNNYFLHFYFKKFRLVIGILALFVQAMLCKVSNATVAVYNYLFNWTITYNNANWQVYKTFNFTKQTLLNIELAHNNSNSHWVVFAAYTPDNDNDYINDNSGNRIRTYRDSSGSKLNYSGQLTVDANKTLYIKASSSYGQSNTDKVVIYETLTTISKTVFTRKSLPRELKSIWNKVRSTLYGYHTNNSRYTGE